MLVLSLTVHLNVFGWRGGDHSMTLGQKVGGGGLEDFSVNPSPFGTNWVFRLGVLGLVV